jgi:hypothetical protein
VTGFGYFGWLMTRMNPFWVIGHDAQPSEAREMNHFFARRVNVVLIKKS